MLEELKNFNPSTAPLGYKHETIEVRPLELKSVFEQDLVLLPLNEYSAIYSPDDFPEQYEPVSVDEKAKIITHYNVKTADFGDSTSITTYFMEYLDTGNVTERVAEGGSQVHLMPLPIYTISENLGKYVPCVRLKDGTRALIDDTTIIPGIKA